MQGTRLSVRQSTRQRTVTHPAIGRCRDATAVRLPRAVRSAVTGITHAGIARTGSVVVAIGIRAACAGALAIRTFTRSCAAVGDVACRATARLRCRHAVGLVAAVGSARRPFPGTVHVLEALRQSSSSACCARNYWIGNCIAAVACELAAFAVRERAARALLRAWDARLAALYEAGDDSAVDHITVPRTRIQATVLRGDNAGAAVWCAHSGLCQSAGIAGWLMALKGVAGIALIQARSAVDKSATGATVSKRTKFWRNRARAVIRLAHYRSCQSPCAACGLHP